MTTTSAEKMSGLPIKTPFAKFCGIQEACSDDDDEDNGELNRSVDEQNEQFGDSSFCGRRDGTRRVSVDLDESMEETGYSPLPLVKAQ